MSTTTAPYPAGLNTTEKEPLSEMNLRRQDSDNVSDVGSSISSSGRRRRRRKNALARQVGGGGLGEVAPLQRLADTKPVRLQLGLDLDVELELKARVKGDVSLTLLQ